MKNPENPSLLKVSYAFRTNEMPFKYTNNEQETKSQMGVSGDMTSILNMDYG